MKRTVLKTVIAAVLLVVIIGFGVWETLFVDRVFGELDERLSSMKTRIDAEDCEGALEETTSAIEFWEDKRRVLELIAYASDLRAFSVAIAEVKGSLEKEDMENAASKTESLFSISHNLHDLLDFNVSDII